MNNEYEMLISLIKFRLCQLSSFLFRYSVGLTTSLLTHLIPVVRKKDSLLKYLISLTLHTEKGKRYRTIFMRALKDKQNTKMEGISVKKVNSYNIKNWGRAQRFAEKIYDSVRKGKLYRSSYVNSRRAETKGNYTTSLLQLGYRIFLPTLKKAQSFKTSNKKSKIKSNFQPWASDFLTFARNESLRAYIWWKKLQEWKISKRFEFLIHFTRHRRHHRHGERTNTHTGWRTFLFSSRQQIQCRKKELLTLKMCTTSNFASVCLDIPFIVIGVRDECHDTVAMAITV